MTDHTPLTDTQLDDIEVAARNAARIGSGIDPGTAIALVAELRRLRAVLDAEKTAHLFTLRQRNNRSRRLALLHDLALAEDIDGLLAAAKDTLAASIDDHIACAEPTIEARRLTESEYNTAWHAVEGAVGEEGADPGTVLHAVLDRLGIALPGAAEQSAVEASEACGKCKQPFDPADTAFDGRARYHLTPYCRGCVDSCHDNEIADHRCVICA